MGRVRRSTRKHYANQTTQTTSINALESPIKKRKVGSQPHGEEAPKLEKASPQIASEDDDIIYLNVGGVTLASNRSTLCQVPGSFLASMFSCRWEGRVKKDRDGNVFLNFNPNCFRLILNYLRSKEISTAEYPPQKPVPTADEYSNFYSLVNYLGLTEEIVAPQSKDRFCDDLSSNICLSDKDLVARHLGKTSRNVGVFETRKNRDLLNYVMGEDLYERGCTQWRLKVTSMERHSSIFIGVLLFGDGPVGMDKEYTKPIWCCEGAFGWDADRAWQSGKPMSDTIAPVLPIPYVSVGTTHVLTFNLDTMCLSLSNGQQTTSMTVKKIEEIVEDPDDPELCVAWCLCIGFEEGTKNEIRLQSN